MIQPSLVLDGIVYILLNLLLNTLKSGQYLWVTTPIRPLMIEQHEFYFNSYFKLASWLCKTGRNPWSAFASLIRIHLRLQYIIYFTNSKSWIIGLSLTQWLFFFDLRRNQTSQNQPKTYYLDFGSHQCHKGSVSLGQIASLRTNLYCSIDWRGSGKVASANEIDFAGNTRSKLILMPSLYQQWLICLSHRDREQPWASVAACHSSHTGRPFVLSCPQHSSTALRVSKRYPIHIFVHFTFQAP